MATNNKYTYDPATDKAYQKALEQLKQQYPETLHIQVMDIGSTESVNAAAAAVAEYAPCLDLIINNAVTTSPDTNKELEDFDLDTVMPGLPHYDFGDMVRSGTNPAEEDEQDLSQVYMRFDMYEALFRGFYASASSFMTPAEKEYMAEAGKIITLEIGTRFLTDYLQGDIYFKTKRPAHNLDRCRTQFKLVESIEEQMPQMMQLLKELK